MIEQKQEVYKLLGTIHIAYWNREKERVLKVYEDLFQYREIKTREYGDNPTRYIAEILRKLKIKYYKDDDVFRLIVSES